MMTSKTSSTTSLKRRKIIIITDDNSIIDRIKHNSDTSLLKNIIIESAADIDVTSSQKITVQTSAKKTTTISGSLTCVVCGSSANGYNFGAITCESCRAFFRRHVYNHPNTLQCHDKQNCKITFETRRNCSACRLAKCFSCGMQRRRVSTDEQAEVKRRKIEENSKTNEEQSQFSTPTLSDDLFNTIDTDMFLLPNFTDLIPSELPRTLLSKEDLQRIETIPLLYEKRIELAARDGLQWDSSNRAVTFLQVLNSYSVSIMRLLSFFKQIPEFNQLNIDDKINLIKCNIMAAFSINATLSYKTETYQVIETDVDAPWNTQFNQIVHGYNLYKHVSKVFGLFLDLAKTDRIIIQLTLITLILTKSFSLIDDNEITFRNEMGIHHAQNYFVELLWKFLETTRGHEKAVCLFTKLIVHIMSWQTIQEKMRKNILRTLSPEDINQLHPIMKSALRIS